MNTLTDIWYHLLANTNNLQYSLYFQLFTHITHNFAQAKQLTILADAYIYVQVENTKSLQ